MPRQLLPGVYAPTQVFYKDAKNTELDLTTIGTHAVRLVKAGMVGIVTNGSNGEAVYLSDTERAENSKATRAALDAAGYKNTPIIAGTSAQSIQATVKLCEEAEQVGVDAVLVMVPSFFKWAMTEQAIEHFFTEVADQSPLPVIIYNFPGAVAGIDLDSDMLIRLAKHPNIVGTKFTCGNVGKLGRVAGATSAVCELTDSRPEKAYFAFSGIADFITPAVEVGGSGAIVGAANVFPRACAEVYKLAVEGKRLEAMKAQQRLAHADWELTKRAIPGFKAILNEWHGYGGTPRAPMSTLTSDAQKGLMTAVQEMIKYEESLDDFGSL